MAKNRINKMWEGLEEFDDKWGDRKAESTTEDIKKDITAYDFILRQIRKILDN